MGRNIKKNVNEINVNCKKFSEKFRKVFKKMKGLFFNPKDLYYPDLRSKGPVSFS